MQTFSNPLAINNMIIIHIIIVVLFNSQRAATSDLKECYNRDLTDVQIAENGHCTLVCAESAFGSKINWYKDKALLNDSFRNNMADEKGEPHITIDSFDILYILHATKNEEGNYACTIDSVKTREYFVKVVSMAKMMNQDFIRYSIYLGFVLCLTFTCYFAGLCVAWHRRASFADPLNLNYGKKLHNTSDNNGEREAFINRK